MVRLARVAFSLFLALVLAACGPGSGGTAQPAGSTTPASAPAASGGGY